MWATHAAACCVDSGTASTAAPPAGNRLPRCCRRRPHPAPATPLPCCQQVLQALYPRSNPCSLLPARRHCCGCCSGGLRLDAQASLSFMGPLPLAVAVAAGGREGSHNRLLAA